MSGRYRLVYHDVVKAVGGDAAFFLAELTAREKFARDNGQISQDGYFELSVNQMAESTGFERRKQYRIIEKLTECGYIEAKTLDSIRLFKITKNNPVQNGRGTSKMDGGDVQNGRGKTSKMDRVCDQNGRGPFYIMNSSLNSSLNSCCEKEEQQQQLNDQIYAFFKSKIKDEEKALAEAWAFVSYNRENFGADHLTFKNYKRHAEEWIKNMGKGKKRSTKSERGTRTAAEVAEAQGITVDELFIRPMPVNPVGVMKAITEDYDSGVDNIIREVFGGAE